MILPLPLPLDPTRPRRPFLRKTGAYSMTLVNLLGAVASTGDLVSTVVVTDAPARNAVEPNLS